MQTTDLGIASWIAIEGKGVSDLRENGDALMLVTGETAVLCLCWGLRENEDGRWNRRLHWTGSQRSPWSPLRLGKPHSQQQDSVLNTRVKREDRDETPRENEWLEQWGWGSGTNMALYHACIPPQPLSW